MKERNFDTAYEEVKELVEKFKQGEKHYLSQSYQEAEVRQDFLDDFFWALGWDVRHKIQHDPYEQEVKVEKGVRVSGAQKRADYSFSIAPNFRDSKFFAEAKKPAKALKNAQDYFQSIRYGWHKAHPLSILTDFEEFHIIDCRYTPDINNSLDKCYKRFHYTDYLNKEKFAEIYFLFSREAVANNSIEKVAETLPKRKGKATTKTLFPIEIHQTIDEAFLEVIDGIREKLAKAFKKKDENLTSEQLTEATQRTVDRLVFIRFLEDKLIEQEHWVSEFGEKGSVWNDFISACKKLDAKYNGIVFKEHFIDERNFSGADENEFRTICQDICHLNSRFLFNEIPIHILGSIYERFLGKVVHATAKRVTVEEKPEVQKAGGVYYTPKYIVDYIVRNTVGKLIEGKTPEQIAKLRFADISCGSGSFLIGVFDCLLDYHNKYYQKHPDKAKKDKCIQKDGLWVLTIKQKQKILLNNIYGVDIDQQATEVTQLSLALKMMEDETTATANEMLVFFHEKILPDMSKNIICGNSLIGTDVLIQTLFSGDEERKLNPMNFEDVFRDIMRNGGFDAIVGNPPYVKARDYDEEKDIYRNILNRSSYYETLSSMWDLYIPFLERGIKLLKEKGTIGFIVPDTLEKAEYSEKIKNYILNNHFVPQIDFFPDSYIFKSSNKVVGVKNVIIFVNKTKANKNSKTKKVIHPSEYTLITSSNIVNYDSSIFSTYTLEVDLKKRDFYSLGEICLASYGLRLNSDKDDKKYKFQKSDLVANVKDKRCWKSYTEGKYLERYFIKEKKYLEWDSERCPKRLVRPTFRELYEVEKILLGRQTRAGVLDTEKIIADNTIIICALHHLYQNIDNSNIRKYYNNVGIERKLLIENSKNYNIKYLLGILNSTATKYFLNILTKGKIDAYPDDWKQIIIPKINFENKEDKTQHDKIVSLVEQMLEAKKEIKSAKTEKDKTYSERKCSSLDTAIDNEVYKLYDLTEEEIKIVEGK